MLLMSAGKSHVLKRVRPPWLERLDVTWIHPSYFE